MKSQYIVDLNKAEHEYCSTQVNIIGSLAKAITNWAKEFIPKDDIYVDEKEGIEGYEEEPHCTVLYGIVNVGDQDKVRDLLKSKGLNKLAGTLGLVDKFESTDYDVVIIKVDSKGLENAHKLISQNVENEDTHKDYHPHVTLAYVQKGKANEFVGKSVFKGKEFSGDVLFSNQSRKKTVLKSKENK